MSDHQVKSVDHQVADLDDVAQLIIDHGFIDVDFASLSERFQVAEKDLVAASGGSLLNAIDRAITQISLEFAWPQPYPTWREFLAQNALALRDFLKQHPGLARLLTCGVSWHIPATHSAELEQRLKQFCFNVNEISLALSAFVFATITERAYAEATLSRTANLAEMHWHGLAAVPENPRKGPLLAMSLQSALRHETRKLNPNEQITPLVMEVWQICAQNAITNLRDWFIDHLDLLLDGFAVLREDPAKFTQVLELTLPAGPPTTEPTPAAAPTTELTPAGPSAVGSRTTSATIVTAKRTPPKIQFPTGAVDGPHTLDDVAELILNYGFIDVDIDRLSEYYQIPARRILAASRDSLSRTTARAVEIMAARENWPQMYSTWQEYALKNCLHLWQTFRDHPGYARIIANGVVGDAILTYIAEFANGLGSFGFGAKQVSFILSETTLFTLNYCANADNILADSCNIADLKEELVKKYHQSRLTKAREFPPNWENLKLKPADLPPDKAGDFFYLAQKITKSFFTLDAQESKAIFLLNLQLAISGIEKQHSL